VCAQRDDSNLVSFYAVYQATFFVFLMIHSYFLPISCNYCFKCLSTNFFFLVMAMWLIHCNLI